MTEDERRSASHAVLIEYADNKRDLHCLRHRLRATARVLEILRIPEECCPDIEDVKQALNQMKSLHRDPREDIQAYAEAVKRDGQLARSVRDHGYGSVVGETP